MDASPPAGRPAPAPVDLPLSLDRASGVGLARQLATQLRAAASGGTLEPGQRLPSTRALALALGVGRNVVFEAYEDLLAEGFLIGRDRSGTFVAPDLAVDHAPGAARPAVLGIKRAATAVPGEWRASITAAGEPACRMPHPP